MKVCFPFVFAFLLMSQSWAQHRVEEFYFGQLPNGSNSSSMQIPFLDDSTFIQNACFSSDAKQFYFTVTDANWSFAHIYWMEMKGSEWRMPKRLFPKMGFTLAAFISNSNQLFFIAADTSAVPKGDIWVSHWQANSWGEPQKLSSPVNSKFAEWEISVAANGNLYFSSDRPGGYGEMDIYYAKKTDRGYAQPINLGPNINGSSLDECPFIAPDESYMIFNSWEECRFGGNNLYIVYRGQDGTWQEPILLTDGVNTDELDIYPNVTPDGKNLIFTRRKEPYNCSEPSGLFWIELKTAIPKPEK